MAGRRRPLLEDLRQVRRMEPFARAVVAGGLLLIAGLWATALADAGSPRWLLGVGLALAGTAGLAVGIRRGLDLGGP